MQTSELRAPPVSVSVIVVAYRGRRQARRDREDGRQTVVETGWSASTDSSAGCRHRRRPAQEARASRSRPPRAARVALRSTRAGSRDRLCRPSGNASLGSETSFVPSLTVQRPLDSVCRARRAVVADAMRRHLPDDRQPSCFAFPAGCRSRTSTRPVGRGPDVGVDRARVSDVDAGRHRSELRVRKRWRNMT